MAAASGGLRPGVQALFDSTVTTHLYQQVTRVYDLYSTGKLPTEKLQAVVIQLKLLERMFDAGPEQFTAWVLQQQGSARDTRRALRRIRNAEEEAMESYQDMKVQWMEEQLAAARRQHQALVSMTDGALGSERGAKGEGFGWTRDPADIAQVEAGVELRPSVHVPGCLGLFARVDLAAGFELPYWGLVMAASKFRSVEKDFYCPTALELKHRSKSQQHWQDGAFIVGSPLCPAAQINHSDNPELRNCHLAEASRAAWKLLNSGQHNGHLSSNTVQVVMSRAVAAGEELLLHYDSTESGTSGKSYIQHVQDLGSYCDICQQRVGYSVGPLVSAHCCVASCKRVRHQACAAGYGSGFDEDGRWRCAAHKLLSYTRAFRQQLKQPSGRSVKPASGAFKHPVMHDLDTLFYWHCRPFQSLEYLRVAVVADEIAKLVPPPELLPPHRRVKPALTFYVARSALPFSEERHFGKLEEQHKWLYRFAEIERLDLAPDPKFASREDLQLADARPDSQQTIPAPAGPTVPLAGDAPIDDLASKLEVRQSEHLKGSLGVFARVDIQLNKQAYANDYKMDGSKDIREVALPMRGVMMRHVAGDALVRYFNIPTGLSMNGFQPTNLVNVNSGSSTKLHKHSQLKDWTLVGDPTCYAAIINSTAPVSADQEKVQPNCMYSAVRTSVTGKAVAIQLSKKSGLFDGWGVREYQDPRSKDPIKTRRNYTDFACHVRLCRDIKQGEELLVDYTRKGSDMVHPDPWCDFCQRRFTDTYFIAMYEREEEKHKEKDILRWVRCAAPGGCQVYLHEGCYDEHAELLDQQKTRDGSWYCADHFMEISARFE